MTMSVVKAKKASDLVAIVAFPVDLKVSTGFVPIVCADLARKTSKGMLFF